MQRTNIGQLGDPALVERLTATLRERAPLSGVAAPLVAKLVRAAVLVDLEPGEALIREGDSAPEIYVLVEGALAVQSKSGRLARLDQPGDVVGEVAVLMSAERSADVVAETAVRALAIPSQVTSSPESADVAAVVRKIVAHSLGSKLHDDWVKYDDLVR